MPGDPNPQPNLDGIREAVEKGFSCNTGGIPVRIVPSFEEYLVDTPEARVVEEDTYLVTSAPPEVTEPAGDLHQVMLQARAMEPLRPGSVLVKAGQPTLITAVLYDYSQEPSCREEWIQEALERILCELETLRVKSVTMPLLGVRNSRLPPDCSTRQLRRALDHAPLQHLKTLWLDFAGLPAGSVHALIPLLEGERPSRSCDNP